MAWLLPALLLAGAHAAASYDLLVIGGGSAGLTAAKFAKTFGKTVAIVEKAKLGGDCTWTGCVPSKTLIAAANAAHAARTADKYGVLTGEVRVDYAKVMARVRATIEKIYSEDDSPEALLKLGIDTVVGAARFVDRKTLTVEQPDGSSVTLTAKEGIVIATGASPAKTSIAGLDETGAAGVAYITYEQIFSLPELPASLTIVGGGPIGCELGQAFARLGSAVTIVAPRLLPALDDEAGEAMCEVHISISICLSIYTYTYIYICTCPPTPPAFPLRTSALGPSSPRGESQLLQPARHPLLHNNTCAG